MVGILTDEAAEVMRREFAQMPGLCLTLSQACRLWQLCPCECEAALDVLANEGFLCRTSDGQYARSDFGPIVVWVE
jgi:hypothetical protein